MNGRSTNSLDLTPALSLGSLSVTFGHTRALDDAKLAVSSGEVHALLGGNGSGKSTLIKVLAGVYRADPGGSLQIFGSDYSLDKWSVAKAKTAGLHFVHQDPAVLNGLTVAENLALGVGFPTTWFGRIHWSDQRRHTRRVLERFEIDAGPDTRVDTLRSATRTMIAVARTLQHQEEGHRNVLVLDEPTASLPVDEVERLFEALSARAARGQTILFVSHRINEVLGYADRVTVLRDGRYVTTLPTQGLADRRLISFMTSAASIGAVSADHALANGSPKSASIHVHARADVLEARRVSTGPLTGVDLRLTQGEIVGVAGLLGSGRTELLRALFGDAPVRSGQLLLAGRPVTFRSPRDAIASGIAFVPEDRLLAALFANQSVAKNLSAAVVSQYWKRLLLRRRRERADASRLTSLFGVLPDNVDTIAGTLSGGNQQKVILARWLRRSPALLLLDEPTQGVDVLARATIYQHVRQVARDGAAVLVASSDFAELAEISDRVVILRDGTLQEEIAGDAITARRITELSYLSEGEIDEQADYV